MNIQFSMPADTGPPTGSHPGPPPGRALWLREPQRRTPSAGRTERPDEESEADTPELQKRLLCRQCRMVITSPDLRTSVQGAHGHTFANPEGLVFQIGCFQAADGCRHVGPATDEFTWFQGFYWRIAVCRNCQAHVGWLFFSSGNDRFYGLILDRLIET